MLVHLEGYTTASESVKYYESNQCVVALFQGCWKLSVQHMSLVAL